MDRNRLHGREGDCININAILSAVGMNTAKLLKWLAALRLVFRGLFGCQRVLLTVEFA